jgi:peptide/nickel transport system substrate-binding protein
MEMARRLRVSAASALLIAASVSGTAFAEKPGGVLRIPVFDNPASMSIHEESAVLAERAMMGVFNNLVIFDQHVPQNSTQSIVPDLATGWNWNEDGTELTLPLREGVKWHDGKPFTAGTSSAPGTCSPASRRRRFASILANPGTETSVR